MSDNYLFKIIVFSLFYLTFITQCMRCEPSVTARCGRPSLPPKAQNYRKSTEKDRFDNKEEVLILCKTNEFPLIINKLECNNGRWKGEPPRCGQYNDGQVIQLNIVNCESNGKQLLVSQQFNQTADAPPGAKSLHPNSFHVHRVEQHIKTTANGSNCYTFVVRFENKIKFWFLLVDIWTETNDTNIGLDLTPFVNKLRTCVEYKKERIRSVFRFYFICDLNNGFDITQEETHLLDTISLNIKTNSTQEVGLNAVYIADIFKTTVGSKKVKPDCGQIQSNTVGVNLQEEVDRIYISCNESFIDSNQNGFIKIAANENPRHEFRCSWNGVWVGNWPVCVPKKTCPQKDIMEKDSSVNIDEIGNVYYLNESQWFAIEYSYVRYSCVNENYIMVGDKVRTCLQNYNWSSKPPFCTKPSISSATIIGILFGVLVIFVSIVLFVFRMHSKRVNRELRETRIEFNNNNKRKSSVEMYADVRDIYDPNLIRRSMAYESVDYEEFEYQNRYEVEQHSGKSQPEYLYMY